MGTQQAAPTRRIAGMGLAAGLALAGGPAALAQTAPPPAPPKMVLQPLNQAIEAPTELRTTVPLGQSLQRPPGGPPGGAAGVPRYFTGGQRVILDVPQLDAQSGGGLTAPAGTPPAR